MECIFVLKTSRRAHSLCASLETYHQILNRIPGISATLDVGHVNTANESPAEYLSTLKDFILDMHIHDNNGKTDEHKCQAKEHWISILC